jgi:hypothetical protein
MKRCRLHGGMSLAGTDAPAFQHGRYSKHLPTDVRRRYEEAVADPELLSLRQDIGLITGRLMEVLEKLDTGESKEAWETLAAEWSRFVAEHDTMSDADRAKSTARITKLVGDGLSVSYVWAEARTIIKERAELVANERKRLLEMQQFISTERAMVLVQSLVETVRRHVNDPAALDAIAADIGSIVGPSALPGAGAGS